MMIADFRRAWLSCLACAALVMPAGPAAAQDDPMRPGSGTPFSITDAFTRERGDLQIEGFFGYERGRDSSDRFEPQLSLKYGLTDRLELQLGSAYALGRISGASRGEASAGLQWRLFDQADWSPAVGLLGQVTRPVGSGDEGLVTELTAIASRTTGYGPGAWGLHVNAGWLARPDPGVDERRHGHRFGAALSHVVQRDTALVVAYVQEAQDRGERDLSVIEAGFERRLGKAASFALAAGAGLNDDSPSFRVTFGMTFEFGLIGGR